ncbi:hypothetical protein [Streptomyces scabiei]|uniref:hypothetical protein n=1 Tax=Streptomyces scabiei TaxID=1930 RepID=UPI0029BDA643|nr:hypothetical protein [Streptomyces scabiei]MDX3519188.1 hypothetical protein [Streptomyces scabiei]
MRSSRTVGALGRTGIAALGRTGTPALGRTGTAGGAEAPTTTATTDRFPRYVDPADPLPDGSVAGPRTGKPGA